MLGARLSRLAFTLAAPLLLIAALANGYAQRPSVEEAAFQTYLWLGGDAAALCGGHPAGHVHCDGCHSVPPSLGVSGATPGRAMLATKTAHAMRLADARTRTRPLGVAPRGPPDWTAA